MHDFGGKLISLQGRADLIGDALDQSHLVILEPVARFTPDQSQQAKYVSADAHRSHQGRASAQRGIENQSKREGKILVQQTKCLSLGQHFHRRGKLSYVERLSVGIDQPLNGISGRMRRGFEGGQTDAPALGIEDAES